MSIKHQEPSIASIGQSPGCDPKTSKRSSGLFSFFKWFKPSVSRESVTQEVSSSSSCDSLNSISSTGTIASFSFVPASDYKTDVTQKNIVPGPETDTYRARLKQRDKRREYDKNLTLRKKYNLFFNRDTLLKPSSALIEETDNSKSLPLMTRKTVNDEEKLHRRTNSESSKIKKAGAYCHVKGKRKAPPPPATKATSDGNSTMSLRRKKRLAPQPPAPVTPDKILTSLYGGDKYDTIEYADADVIFNDSLKLDHGILKPTKNPEQENLSNILSKSPRSSYMEAPVSPRPWYKRNLTRDIGVISKKDRDEKYEPLERLPDVQYSRISSITDLTSEDIKVNKKKEDKRKSGIAFLTNISELDREASEIIKKEHQNDNTETEIPQFMRPKQEQNKNTDSWMSPKRKSARDLIAKFNAITNVTKVTVNSTFFGARESGVFQKDNLKREYFGKTANELTKETKPETQFKLEIRNTENQNVCDIKNPLMKSESSVIKYKESSKLDKKSWYCPKCSLENDYWRIICYVCSTIKPYFDDLTTPPAKINSNTLEKNKTENSEIKHFPPNTSSDASKNTPAFNFTNGAVFERNLERSKTQIGFSALAKYNESKDKNRKFVKSVSTDDKPIQNKTVDKQGEKERLKKMLIEMKNSLPKRKHNFFEKQTNRASIIQENVENEFDKKTEENTEEKTAEVTVMTQETIYENIKVKKTENPKPIKITASSQTSAVSEKQHMGAIQKQEVNKKFELMRPKDFANIYSVKTDKPNQHIYSNLLENKDLFLNMPVKLNEIKNSLGNNDTLEINRLLKRLETAIARGELSEASNFARELAQLKVNCSVIRQKSVDSQEEAKGKTGFIVDMYVEDKISHRGPFQINISEDQSVAELKLQVEKDFQIPVVVQRWILGKELATDDNATLKDFHVTTGGCSIFLYLVAPTNDHKPDKIKPNTQENIDIENAQSSEKNKIETEVQEKAVDHKDNLVDEKEETPPNHVKCETLNGHAEIAIASNMIAKFENFEDIEDYDSHTLKPEKNRKTWECIMCTFINEQLTNVCAICSTIRKINSTQGKSTYTRNKRKAPQPAAQKEQHYLQLLNLDNSDLVESTEQFDCLICLSEIKPRDGVTLRECLHQFCKKCLAHTIEFTEEAEVKCPYRDNDYSCDISLQDREIKALVSPELYEQFLAKSVAQAENKIDKSFHCKTPDCKGWCIFEDNVNEFHCPVCSRNNCLTCQAIHIGLNCKEYQEEMNESVTDEGTKRTKEMLEEMVNKGEAIKCPTCHVILMKKWGCDWLRCSMCKTEICWVTRGPRWGPAGKGDTSGGCQCGVNGMKCHPQCNYCH